jgi:hypothetical protein
MPVGKRTLSENPVNVYKREYARELRKRGFCSCGAILSSVSTTRCKTCLENNRKSQANLRKRIIEHYGGKCVCCGITELKFLALDHENGNGNKHRFEVTGHKRGSILHWIIRNNFPSIFQVLCHNCNMAKGCYGACPHQECK